MFVAYIEHAKGKPPLGGDTGIAVQMYCRQVRKATISVVYEKRCRAKDYS
jgi:hypothetical protein